MSVNIDIRGEGGGPTPTPSRMSVYFTDTGITSLRRPRSHFTKPLRTASRPEGDLWRMLGSSTNHRQPIRVVIIRKTKRSGSRNMGLPSSWCNSPLGAARVRSGRTPEFPDPHMADRVHREVGGGSLCPEASRARMVASCSASRHRWRRHGSKRALCRPCSACTGVQAEVYVALGPFVFVPRLRARCQCIALHMSGRCTPLRAHLCGSPNFAVLSPR